MCRVEHVLTVISVPERDEVSHGMIGFVTVGEVELPDLLQEVFVEAVLAQLMPRKRDSVSVTDSILIRTAASCMCPL